MKRKTTAIILAAGNGSRMNSDITKQRMTVLGKTLLKRSVTAFEETELIDDIIVVVRDDETDFARRETEGFTKVRAIVTGGKTRRESAERAVGALSENYCGIIMIHDAARCLICKEDISSVAKAAYESGAASAVYAVFDTVKLTDKDGRIIGTVDRDTIRIAATPQAFDFALYKQAMEKSADDDAITDDNMLLEKMGIPVTAVNTSRQNIKITTPEDILYAEYVIGRNADKYE